MNKIHINSFEIKPFILCLSEMIKPGKGYFPKKKEAIISHVGIDSTLENFSYC
jgi:hypothetical protein